MATREIVLFATLVLVTLVAVVGNYAGQRMLAEQTQRHQGVLNEYMRLHRLEVQDLMDRIQAKSLPEYKAMTQPARPKEPKEPKEVVDPL